MSSHPGYYHTMPPSAVDSLAALLPDGTVVADADILAGYRHDRSQDPHAGTPLALVRPTDTEHVATVLRWAGDHRVAVIPRGAGTGLSGGATAQHGALVLSTERMRSIAVDVPTRTAVAQPGLTNAQVKRAAAEVGLWYPPDPSSFESCSIGGNAATNAGGLCCVKYGVTTDYVLGMEVVLADATVVRLGGPYLKDSAGLSLAKLFIGSEGTLGVITELTLRLLPAQPPQSTVVASFTSVVAACEAVTAMTAQLRPAMLELMDSAAINAVEDVLRMGLRRDAAALLLARSDAPCEHAGQEATTMAQCCEKAGAIEVFATSDPEEGEAFTAARRFAIPAMERNGAMLMQDIGVALPQLPDLVTGIAEIARAHGVTVSIIAHAGDGNTHPLIHYDPHDATQAAAAHKVYDKTMDLAIALGGTITGEHGVGRLKKPWLPAQLGPEAMALTHRLKQALDPHNILNPGAIV